MATSPTPPPIDVTPQAPPAIATQPSTQESMPAPQVPTEAPNQAGAIPQAPEPHHGALAGILAAIAGPQVIHHVNPVTGQMQTIQAPSAPGDAFKRILSGALIGMGVGGPAGRGGAGLLGGIGAGGTAAIQHQNQLNQQDIQNQENDFQTQQRAKLEQASIAHTNQEIAASQWRATREGWEMQSKAAEQMNKMSELVASDPANKNLGHYDSFRDFIQKHPEIAPNLPQLQAKGLLQVVPELDGTKPAGLSIYEIHPGWADQKNEKPITLQIQNGVDDKGNPKYQPITIPAGGISNGDFLKATSAEGAKELKSAQNVYDAQQKHVDVNIRAQTQEDIANKKEAGANARAAMRYNQLSKGQLTSATRTMIETAPRVLSFVDKIDKMVDQQKATLGPAASRWNEFMASKVGAPNADFIRLRTDVGLLQTALMRMHVGARGGEYIMKHFEDLINSAKQSPENMHAALGEIRDYANELKSEGQGGGMATGVGGGPPTGGGTAGQPVFVNGQLVGHTRADGKMDPVK